MRPTDPYKGDSTKFTRRRFVRNIVLGGFAACAVDAFAIEPRWLRIRKEVIDIEGLPDALNGYRVGLLADTHIPRSISRAFLNHACETLVGLRPDVIAVAGDVVQQKRGVHWSPSLKGYFDSLRAPDGVFGTLGNHDHWVDADEVKKKLDSDTPIELLHGRHVSIRRKGMELLLGGVDDLWSGNTDVDAAFSGADPKAPRLLISHNPDLAEDSRAKTRVDLMLSGHTHGGQVRIPFGPSIHTPSKYKDKFAMGLIDGKRYRAFVTTGVCTVFWLRFCCRPEVCLLTLRRAAG